MTARDYGLVLHIDVDLDERSGGEAALPVGLESGQVVIEAGSQNGRTWWRVRDARPDADDDGPVVAELADTGDPLDRLLAFLGVVGA